ncbi:hypothetical protein [Rubellimicrobium roseum]|uniref:Uncharacterized protein n=1 Tax=Rubellimicrobium roseum TaxID=687525 RepID=A0A5C4N820_9RHOB|nr:hypothetical protein [Rubellimicrobium roseum]TNC69827.1 hypothetical protein FHG71_13495 [Rubellimicrobium roseum]
MIELAFVVCLGTEPMRCEQKAMQFADVSLMACLMGAQPQLAEWLNDHPGWEVRRWTCQPLEAGRRT